MSSWADLIKYFEKPTDGIFRLYEAPDKTTWKGKYWIRHGESISRVVADSEGVPYEGAPYVRAMFRLLSVVHPDGATFESRGRSESDKRLRLHASEDRYRADLYDHYFRKEHPEAELVGAFDLSPKERPMRHQLLSVLGQAFRNHSDMRTFGVERARELGIKNPQRLIDQFEGREPVVGVDLFIIMNELNR